jgi:chromosome partitioning protein
MSYIIAVSNEKGGVAKTTTAISLGGAFVEQGKRVLLIDLDSQANLTLAMAVDPEKNRRTSVNVLLEKLPVDSVKIETGIPGLDLLPSNNEMGFAERYLPTRPGYEKTLATALEPVQNNYDIIIIDCPPFLGAVTLNALCATNLLILPTQAEYFSIYALRNMMGLIRRVRSQNNPKLTYRILLTMYDRRNKIHRTLHEQLQTTFQNGLFNNLIQIDTKLRESSIAGMPIIFHSPNCRSAVQYRSLAEEVTQYVQEETIATPA